MCRMAGVWTQGGHAGMPELLQSALNRMAAEGAQADGGIAQCGEAWLARQSCPVAGSACHSGGGEHDTGRFVWTGELYDAPGDATAWLLGRLEREGPGAFWDLEGSFALALASPGGGLLLARDRFGIEPLYWGRDEHKRLWFASEIKALCGLVNEIEEFPPGHYWTADRGLVQFGDVPAPEAIIAEPGHAVAAVADALEAAVATRLSDEAACGSFLSGGLDSSLVVAIAQRQADAPLKTFGAGLTGSADLHWSQQVADWLGTDHHTAEFSPDDVIAALPHVIEALETFDPALVRGAIATYLVSRLAADHVQVVLSGEGADELFAGYDYLRRYDEPELLSEELRYTMRSLHNTNLQRVDRMTQLFGLQARVPFLDRRVVETAFRIDPDLKMHGPEQTEKWILRKVAERYLPHDVVWRKKEKFAIGTGVGDVLKAYAESEISDDEFAAERVLPGGFTLKVKEELLYYRIFSRFYPFADVASTIGRSRSLDPEQVLN